MNDEDISRLTEIKIRKITKFDQKKHDQNIKLLEENLKEVDNNLKYLKEYVIKFYEIIFKKYSNRYSRKSEIITFDKVKATNVAISNKKLYVNKKEGFIGYNIKGGEYISDCSDIDLAIIFYSNGKYLVVFYYLCKCLIIFNISHFRLTSSLLFYLTLV